MVEKGSIIVDVIPRRLGRSGWPNAAGISGRMPSESVAECRRNQWPNGAGIRTRLVKCAKESAGKRHGYSSKKIGNAYLKLDYQVFLP